MSDMGPVHRIAGLPFGVTYEQQEKKTAHPASSLTERTRLYLETLLDGGNKSIVAYDGLQPEDPKLEVGAVALWFDKETQTYHWHLLRAAMSKVQYRNVFAKATVGKMLTRGGWLQISESRIYVVVPSQAWAAKAIGDWEGGKSITPYAWFRDWERNGWRNRYGNPIVQREFAVELIDVAKVAKTFSFVSTGKLFETLYPVASKARKGIVSGIDVLVPVERLKKRQRSIVPIVERKEEP